MHRCTVSNADAVYALFLPAESYEQDMGCGIQPFNCTRCWDEEKKLKFWWVGPRGAGWA